MIKTLVLTFAVMASTSVFAQTALPPALDKLVREKCAEGCLVLSPADVAELEARVNAFAQDAYKKGVAAGSKAAPPKFGSGA